MNQRTKDRIDKAVLETLEDRRLLSSVTFDHGVLTVTGDADARNLLTVRPHTNGRHLVVNRNGTITYHKRYHVENVSLVGGSREDVLYVDPAVRAGLSVFTGDGIDTVFASDGDDRYGDSWDDVRAASKGTQIVTQLEQQRASSALRSLGNLGAVNSFSLINSGTGQTIAGYENLVSGATLDLSKLPTRNLGIRANVSGGQSVRFYLSGKQYGITTENSAPYAVRSNYAWTPEAGTYKLTATPFGFDGAMGLAGQNKTVTLTIVDEPTTPPIAEPAPEDSTGDPIDDAGEPAAPPIDTTGGTDTPDNTNTDTDPTSDDTTTGGETGGGSVPTGTTDPTDTGTDVIADVDAPEAVVTVLDSSVQLGHAIHVHAMNSLLKHGQAIEGRYEWDFGDPGSKYNTLVGYNAAHLYERPGTYTVTLKLTNSLGKTDTATASVTVTAASRRRIYVSSAGSDSNSGLSPDAPVRTFAAAATMLDDNTEILFHRGETFSVFTTMRIASLSNVVVGAYGTGVRPVLKWAASLPDSGDGDFISISGSKDVVVQDLSFDSYMTAAEGKTHLVAVRTGGTNNTVRNIQVLTIDQAVNNNRDPVGVLVIDNIAPLASGMRGNFTWINGTDLVFLGNVVANSVHENVLRASGWAERILVAHNDLANPDLGAAGDRKAGIVIQTARYAYIANNIVRESWLSVGPLGGSDGLDRPEARTQHSIVEGNTLIDSLLRIDHGAEHTMVRDNVIRRDGANAIWVDGYNSTYDRMVSDLFLLNNTAVNAGTYGPFLRVGGDVDGITLNYNLYVAPNIKLGSYSTAYVNVTDTDLSSFREISGNIWPDATTSSGGVHVVGLTFGASTFLTASAWEAKAVVEGDVYRDVTLSGSYQTTLSGLTAGANVARA